MSDSSLPLEIIDYIFSFLRDDAHTLQKCACINASLCAIAERHIYNNIVLHNTGHPSYSGYLSTTGLQLSKILATTPHITKYVKSVQVTITAPSLLQWIMARSVNDEEIAPVLSKLIYVERFSLIGWRNREIAFTELHLNLQASILNVFRSCAFTEIVLSGVLHFPLSALKDCPALKKLSLLRCTCVSSDDRIIDSDARPRLESLVVHLSSYLSSPMEELLFAAQLHFDITSLRHFSVEASRASDYGSVVRILMLCSRSLRVLQIKSGGEVNTGYDPYSGSVLEPVDSAIPLDLSDMQCLQSLSITGRLWSSADFWISSTGEESLERVTYDAPFPWLAQILEKAPASLTRIVIHLLFYIDSSTLKRIDWALLANALLPIAHLKPINLLASFGSTKSNFSIDHLITSLKEDHALAELCQKGILSISVVQDSEYTVGHGAHL